MRHRPRLLFLAFSVLAVAAAAAAAIAEVPCMPAPRFAVEVLVDGRPVSTLTGRGATYIEATRGREYAVRLTNRTGERVAVALSVDGLNAIDARHTTARDGRKWILDPWETITLEGWQTSGTTARRFFFTDEARSYGAWLGRTADLGVVSAAFFRERPRPVAKLVAPELDAPAAAQAAPRAEGQRKDAAGSAATGIGREIEHRVHEVDFDAEDAPAQVVTLRYEYHDALVKLGILPAPEDDGALARRERARGFEDAGFAPDPYAKR